MNNDSIIFIGFDTHKSFIQIATLKDDRGAKPENYGRALTAPRPPLISSLVNVSPSSQKPSYILFMKRVLVAIGYTDF